MARVLVISDRDSMAEALVTRLRAFPPVRTCVRAPQREDGFGGEFSGGYAGLLDDERVDTIVYAPPFAASKAMLPDLSDAEVLFHQCAHAQISRFVLLSSAMVYGAGPHNPGLISESRSQARNSDNAISRSWADLEGLAQIYLGGHTGTTLTILRPAAVIVGDRRDYFDRLFRRSLAVTLPGHDPSVQLLTMDDLAAAVCCAVARSEGGVYNVAPDGVVPLGVALRLAGALRVPAPRWIQRIVRSGLAPLGLGYSMSHLEYIRYSWTISNKKIKSELGFSPAANSAEAPLLRRSAKAVSSLSTLAASDFDQFGMDKSYIDAYGRTLFKFLHDYYWRVEVNGLERLPREGRAVLVGVHRGFMPWDGVMALHLLARAAGRYPRFLIHPTLVKFPFLFNFMTKLGGVIACQENADYLLDRDEMVGIFPEGINGAFVLYRDAYRLGKFGRDEFVKIALRNRAPIVPFITVGSAEIFPILKRLDWRWWKRYTEWPCLPLTPTFPLLPVPLPSKWHTQFLPPMHIENQYPPEAAEDLQIVRAISRDVRKTMSEAIEQMLKRRKSVFFGSVFEQEASRSDRVAAGAHKES